MNLNNKYKVHDHRLVFEYSRKERDLVTVQLLSKEGGTDHKVLTYIEYKAVSGVFRTIDPTHSLGGDGVDSEDARHWIGLLQYNPSKDRTRI